LITQSTPLHKHLLDNLNLGVVLLDSHGKISYVNPAAEMLLGASPARLVQQPFCSLVQDNRQLITQLESVINTQKVTSQRAAEWELSLTGEQMVVDYTMTSIASTDDFEILIEIERIDRWLKISQEEAMRAAHDTGRSIVRGMAHEIKNPLGGIIGATQLLAKEIKDSEHEEFCSIIIEEANRLRNLVDRMLGPRHLPQLAEQNIHELLEHVLSLSGSRDQLDLKIKRDYDPSIPLLLIDKEQIIQSLFNLINNALNALTEAKTEQPQLTIKTRIVKRHRIDSKHSQHMACIDIGDNGPGVKEELKETLFFPMITGSAAGTGLGLSITQSIIHQHRGSIHFDSQPGNTHFTIYLPIEEDHV